MRDLLESVHLCDVQRKPLSVLSVYCLFKCAAMVTDAHVVKDVYY